MTETRIGQQPDFVPHAAHRQMNDNDANVFSLAADMYAHPDIRAAIMAAGGDDANLAHISREVAGGRPASAWAASVEHDEVIVRLRALGRLWRRGACCVRERIEGDLRRHNPTNAGRVDVSSKWLELGDVWTDEIRSKCQDLCEGDPPCYELAGSGLVGGDVEFITPCRACRSPHTAGEE